MGRRVWTELPPCAPDRPGSLALAAGATPASVDPEDLLPAKPLRSSLGQLLLGIAVVFVDNLVDEDLAFCLEACGATVKPNFCHLPEGLEAFISVSLAEKFQHVTQESLHPTVAHVPSSQLLVSHSQTMSSDNARGGRWNLLSAILNPPRLSITGLPPRG